MPADNSLTDTNTNMQIVSPERPDSGPAIAPTRDQGQQTSNPGAQENATNEKKSKIDTKPRNNVLHRAQLGKPSRSSSLDQEGSGNQQKDGHGVVDQRSTHPPQAGATEDKMDDQMEKKGKSSGHSNHRSTTQRRPAPPLPQQGQQGGGSEPEGDQELLDAGYDVVGAQQALGADEDVHVPPNTDRHNTRSTAHGSGSSDGSVTRHNNAVGASRSGPKKSQDGSPPLPHRPRPSDRPVDMDEDDGTSGLLEESTDPPIPGSLSHQHHHVEHHHHLHHHQQQHQQHHGADEGGTYGPHEYGSSTTSSWGSGITSLFSRGGSGAGSGGSDAPPRRDKTKEELANTKRELERSQKEARFYRKELEQSNYNLQQAIGDNRVHARNNHELQSANARLKDHLLSSQHELANVQRKLDDAKVLADTRGRELQGAQVFLTKADSLAISDLSARVTQLNEEIFQAAASLGEAVCRNEWSLPDEEAIRCAEDASRLIGRYLVLATHEHAKNPDAPVHPFLVQVVLQVFLNTFCVEKIRMWAPSEPIHDDYIRSLYQAIWEKEEQAVSGRWRALTRSQLRPDTSTWSKELLDSLMKVFQSASWGFSSPDAQRTIENQLSPIFKGILEVRMALGEKFTSADIEVDSIGFGQKFDSAYMEDAYGDDRRGGGSTGPDRVLATAGMALRKNMPPGSQYQYEKVLPAKVVLESSLKAALEPVPSRKKSRRQVDAKSTPLPPPAPPMLPSPQQVKSEQVRPEQARPEQARPEQTSGDAEMSEEPRV